MRRHGGARDKLVGDGKTRVDRLLSELQRRECGK